MLTSAGPRTIVYQDNVIGESIKIAVANIFIVDFIGLFIVAMM